MAPENLVGAAEDEGALRGERLASLASRLAGARGRARVVYDSDPAEAIVRAAAEEAVDIVVVGNVSMSERQEFLLSSIPNRVSHRARCSVVIVNTAGAAAAAGAAPPEPARQSPDGRPTEGQLLGRAARIGRVMAKYGLRELAGSRTQKAAAATAASRFRAALEELGPTFAKLGQILSTRPDLLPPAFVQELATLQDRVKPLTEAEVVAVMEQELGVPWEDVFESIEPDPMAAGTIAQVHRAVLSGGDRVVVKVQRPNAEGEILQDLGLLEAFGREAAGQPVFRQVVDLPAMIEHLSAALRRELDFREEAANIERMRAVLEPFPRLGVPRVYRDILTRRLLVMEEIQGIPVLDAPEGEARREAARQLLEAYYRQVLTEGFFHADPHPGNLMWWDGRVFFLDFGMVGEMEPAARELLLLLLLAFWQEDSAYLGDILLMLAGDEYRPNLDQDAFREELAGLMARYRHLPLRDLRLGPIIQELTEISLRHDVRMPASLALAGKAFGQMQLAAAELDPSLDPFTVAGSFLFKQVSGGVRELASPRRLFYEGQKLRIRLARLVEGVERVVGARPGPSLQVEFRGTERLERTVEQAGRRVALAVTAGGALLGAALTLTSTHLIAWVPAALGALGAVTVAVLLADLLRTRA
jgi:predicted unusual protein kinase regulating ubiquinone biosynthesis (AarF/ABC1/UbiB family)